MNAGTYCVLWRSVASIALLGAAAPLARATTFDWNNTAAGTFGNPVNWNPVGGPPGPADTARFALAANSTVTFSAHANVSAFTQNTGNLTFFLNGFTLQATAINISGMGADDSTATLRMVNGFFAPAGFTVGGNPGSSGTLTLDTSMIMTVNSGVFQVGNNGTGTLIVQNGSQLTTNADTRLATNASGVGTATIQGAGSSWTIPNNTLRIGVSNDAVVNVLNGATVTAKALEVGEGLSTNGAMNVSGAGATFTTSGVANIGGLFSNAPADSATLNIGAGATVNLGGTTNLRTTAAVSLTGGTLSLNTLNVAPGAVFNFSAGAVNFANASAVTPDTLDFLLAGTNTLGTNRTLSAGAGTLNLTTPLAISGGTLGAADLTLNANMNIGAFGSVTVSGLATIESGKTLHVEDFGTLSGGGTVVNNGGVLELKGALATVSAFMANNFGVVQGTGRFAGGLNNGVGGTIRARAGDHLIIEQLGPTNPGRIELTGGVVEYTKTLSNLGNGIITDRGEFRGGTSTPGSTGLSNIGTVALSGGITDVRGGVNNASTGKIIISGGGLATFYDSLTHNGAEFRVSTGSTAVFFGNVSGSGSFTGGGTKIFEGGVSMLSALASITGDTTVESGASLTTGHVREDALTVSGTGVLTITPNGAASGTSRVNALVITGDGQMDLKDNKLIVAGGTVGTASGGTYSGLTGLIQSGRDTGTWGGAGLTTSMPDAASGLTALGIATAEQTGHAGDTFGGLGVASGDVLVMYTYAGDANLDGVINIDDYGRIDANVAQSGSVFGWYNGDFNYDGSINIDDYGIIDGNISRQGAPFLTDAGDVGELNIRAVPEPMGMGWVLGAAGLLHSIRRRRFITN